MNHRPISLWRRLLPGVVLLLALMAAVYLFTNVLGAKADDEALAMAEETIRRAAVTCYALEGAYPTDVDHLYETYGVTVDQERYIVHYEYVAANLIPDITVLPAP